MTAIIKTAEGKWMVRDVSLTRDEEYLTYEEANKRAAELTAEKFKTINNA